MKAHLFFLLFILGALSACKSNSAQQEETEMEVSGIIEKTGITSYQYGSHTITGENTFYALTSEKVDLSKFEGQEVTVVGEKIEGYSLDGGPEYLRVKEIKD